MCWMSKPSLKSWSGACRGRHEGQPTSLKYRLALIADGVCVLRYDNEAGKGNHRHVDDAEGPYDFTTPEVLVADFWRDVEKWRRR